MANLTPSEKRHIPIYDDPSQVQWGMVSFDYDKCTSCGLCIKSCPSISLEMVDKKVSMKKPIECMMCSDCVAICPEGAIIATRNYRYTGRFKTLGFGELQKPRL